MYGITNNILAYWLYNNFGWFYCISYIYVRGSANVIVETCIVETCKIDECQQYAMLVCQLRLTEMESNANRSHNIPLLAYYSL